MDMSSSYEVYSYTAVLYENLVRKLANIIKIRNQQNVHIMHFTKQIIYSTISIYNKLNIMRFILIIIVVNSSN